MFYFAYGSNLNRRHMARRAPRAKSMGPARLDGYTLVFRRFVDIVPAAAGVVWGAVYEITPACERALDAYEEFPALYRKINVTVNIAGGTHTAMAYAMNDAAPAPPSVEYFTALVRGYRDWKLDPAPLTAARIAAMHQRTPPKAPPGGGAEAR